MVRRKEKKPNPRPKIDYPPVPTRTWIPPDQRPKKKRKPKYEKPPGITQHLEISSLATVWHKYRVFEDRILLCGNYSETYKKYTLRSNGYQTPCNCIMGITFSKLVEMPKWTSNLIDSILDLGNMLYLESVTKTPKNKGKTNLALCEINDTFLIEDSKITMTMKGTKYTGKLFKDLNKTPYLQNVIKDFFNDKYVSGIIHTQNKFIAFWSVGKTYYLFDPIDHTYKGHPWNDISGQGFSVVMRLNSTKAVVDIIHENIDQRINSPFVITPCSILRIIKLNTIPPEVGEIKIRHCEDPEVSVFKIVPARRAPMVMEQAEEEVEEEEEEEEKEIEVTDLQEIKFEEPEEEDEYAPEVLEEPKEVASAMIPLLRAKAESVSYFANIVEDKIGILRASTHQTDERFTNRRGGVQSVTNAISALVMLRIYKSKYWFKRILDDVLVLGEKLYKQSMAELPTNERLKVTNVAKVITFQDHEYTPDVDEFTVVGKMQSKKDDVLDLLPALQEFFLNNNACIITGPLIMAIWEEDGLYYMFDPNERDSNGLTIIKSLQIGSELQVLDFIPGVACVTWYKNLKDLVEIYINNLQAKHRRDTFILSRVQIKDYSSVPEPWNNFQGLAPGKWIIRATFNQNDRRFERETRNTQCTAVSAVALAYSMWKHVKGWTTDDLDEILLQGDNFYKLCVEELKENNKYIDPKLLVDELKRSMVLEGKEIKFTIEDCLFNGLLDAKNVNDAMNLNQALHEFFKDNDTAIVTARYISVAVWRTDGIYYYFDSHSRDENGIVTNFGTACLMRMPHIEDVAKAIESNFGAGTNNIFNVSLVAPKIWDVGADGIVRPPLNNYKEINVYTAILRSLYSERSPLFKLNRGKQTIPMCLAASAMTKIYPSALWSRDILDEILYVGDKLYTDTMVAREKIVDLSETDDIDEVYAENCLMEFYIGVNKFDLNYGDVVEGNFENDFQNALVEYFNQKPIDENDLKQLLIASDVYTIVVWLDESLFYLFDPKPRDDRGQIYGKEEWSLKIIEDYEEDGDDLDDYLIRITEMDGAGDAVLPSIPDEASERKKSVGSQATEHTEGEVPKKHSARYWRMQEEAGKATTMWFTNIENLITHIIENIPPTKREDIIFKMFPINVGNKPDLRNIFDATGAGERPDNYAGDWYEFKEIDYGRWILRGTVDYTYVLFPEHNRTRQSIAMAYVAIGYAHHYALNKFKETTVNEILKYGDRLHSATRNVRYKDLKTSNTIKLSEDEIEAILNHEEYGIDDIARTFCIGKDETHLDVMPESIVGDTTAYEIENLLDVERALTTHFETNRFGILSAKKLSVAVWRGAKVYYMFDPHSCGPNGVKCMNGKACLTRYLEVSSLSDVFLKNLDKEGQNRFVIHTVSVRVVPCPKEFISEEPEPDEPKFVGYNKIMPGKCILLGSISQEDPKFARGINAQCAAISVVALTMTLLHKASLWTKPMVDEIVINGDELYIASIDSLGFDYNPWEQSMTLRLINQDYKVGTLKANCQMRTMDQQGIIDTKHPKVLNLRQGIERFFEENTHGVIETETLTVAIWEEGDTDPVLIYMFDPNPRGPAGMALVGGAACVLTFESPKLASDHFISNIVDPTKRTGEYVISPVEIVVGDKKTKMKTKKDPCKAKSEPDVRNPSPTECEKKRLRKMAEEERKRKEAAKLEKIGRHKFHELPNGDSILRGMRSQSSKHYTEETRGNQDIPNCLAAFVVNRLVTVMKWHHKHIDMILDVGDTLYKDSYITYQPKDKKLGFKNVLRKVFIKDVRVALRIYKPVMTNILTPFNLEMALMNYFQQEIFCILSVLDDYVALFFKQGCYYIFDPHDRDIDGNSCESGWACVLKFMSLPNLVDKFISNIMYQKPMDCEVNFTVTLVTIGSITKKTEDIATATVD